LPALPYPKYGITNLYLFPSYATPEDFEKATGQACPPWDPTRAPKHWYDPKPVKKFVGPGNIAYTSYDRVWLGSRDAANNPVLDPLVISMDQAAAVNIAPTGPGTTNIPGADVPEVPAPMRALEPNEELFFDWGGILTVKNTELFSQLVEVGFSQHDRDLLAAIAKKLGVS
jgi:hypothetical protein